MLTTTLTTRECIWDGTGSGELMIVRDYSVWTLADMIPSNLKISSGASRSWVRIPSPASKSALFGRPRRSAK
jgi:hypothetical protein